ncbi:hypothetical protein DFH27DRAFT_42728 [Peziza echinospora]|nr:hypothetical protein DFH27DRAFT_42728 [Peziza echinospora]
MSNVFSFSFSFSSSVSSVIVCLILPGISSNIVFIPLFFFLSSHSLATGTPPSCHPNKIMLLGEEKDSQICNCGIILWIRWWWC